MIEVEIKLKISDKADVIHKLEAQGFRKTHKVTETDIYFNGNDRDFRRTDEALRIRRTEDSDDLGKTTNKLTYKGRRLDNISMTREETEISIDDFEGMNKILLSLGYRPVRPVVKTREYYEDDKMTALIDDVEGLGDYLELEIMAEDESFRSDALRLIELELKELGYSLSDTTTTSYLTMLEALDA